MVIIRHKRLLAETILKIGFTLGIAFLLISIVQTAGAEFTVYASGSNFIVWNTSGVTNVSVDGNIILNSPSHYGQYNLQPGSIHFISNANNTSDSLFVRLPASETDTLLFWIFFIILYSLIVVSYKWPISCVLPVIYGLWLITTYIPSHTTEYGYYLIAVVGIILSIFAGFSGYRR